MEKHMIEIGYYFPCSLHFMIIRVFKTSLRLLKYVYDSLDINYVKIGGIN